jgi:hypothetical protein
MKVIYLAAFMANNITYKFYAILGFTSFLAFSRDCGNCSKYWKHSGYDERKKIKKDT